MRQVAQGRSTHPVESQQPRPVKCASDTGIIVESSQVHEIQISNAALLVHLNVEAALWKCIVDIHLSETIPKPHPCAQRKQFLYIRPPNPSF